MSSLLEITPSTIVARLATGNLKAATPAEVVALLGLGNTVLGPVSSTDNALVRFDATTGTIIKNSTAILTDAGALSGITSLAMSGALSGVTTLNMSGALTVGGTVNGRDIAGDGSKLDGIEALADVTDAANVISSLDGASIPSITPVVADKILLQDVGSSDALGVATITQVLALGGGGGGSAVKNFLINGNFNIWQRGTSFTGIANAYGADRWAWRSIGAGVVDMLRSTDVPDGLSVYSCHIDVTTADASLAATDFYGLEYRIEGLDAIPLAFGTAEAVSVAISFWVKSTKTGIHSVALQNSAVNRSYVAEYTVNVTDTWEKKTVSLAGDTSGTWLKDTGIGVALIFAVAAGSNFTGTAGAWNAADDKASTNQVNGMDSATNNFRISQVQLEAAASAGDFTYIPFAEELALCKRYYQKTFPYAVTPVQNVGDVLGVLHFASAGASTEGRYNWQLPVQLNNGTPTVTFYNPFAANTNWYNVDRAADSGGSLDAGQTDDSRIAAFSFGHVSDTVPDLLVIHATAEAEI